tara:strand:- start:851 stop:1312 length:462 start_codon:yes stop_codon:yes gene_type:complete
MANIKVYKDDHSFHIFNLLDYNESISYDFVLSKAYSVVLGKGIVNIGTDKTSSNKLEAIGLHNISAGEKLNCASIENTRASFVVSVLLDDASMMSDLVPNGSLLSQLISSSSHLTPFEYEDYAYKIGPTENYGSGNVILTTDDIGTKITEGLV